MRRTCRCRQHTYGKQKYLRELALIDAALLDWVLRIAQCLLCVGLMLFC